MQLLVSSIKKARHLLYDVLSSETFALFSFLFAITIIAFPYDFWHRKILISKCSQTGVRFGCLKLRHCDFILLRSRTKSQTTTVGKGCLQKNICEHGTDGWHSEGKRLNEWFHCRGNGLTQGKFSTTTKTTNDKNNVHPSCRAPQTFRIYDKMLKLFLRLAVIHHLGIYLKMDITMHPL